MCMYVGVCLGVHYVSTKNEPPPDQNDFKLGTIVVLDTVSKAISLGFKVWGTRSTFRNFGNSCHLANKNHSVAR